MHLLGLISNEFVFCSSPSRISSAECGGQVDDETWYSIFPVDTPELVNGAWEKDIIWDIEQMERIPEPKVLELDPNDENIVIYMPDDVDPRSLHNRDESNQRKYKIQRPYGKKSKIMLGKLFMRDQIYLFGIYMDICTRNTNKP
jgi:hypothetical protein